MCLSKMFRWLRWVSLTSLCWIGKSTKRELSAVNSGSGNRSPADSLTLKFEICISPRSFSIE